MPTLDVVIPSFNSGASLAQTLNGVLNQNFRDTMQLSVVVVDDASNDNSISSLPINILNAIKIITLSPNQGRAIARNSGATSGISDHIVFLDSDCEPQNENSFQLLLDSLNTGLDVVYASVKAKGTGFWVNYFNEVSKAREKIAGKGNLHGFSSQYFAVSRSAFETSGGFNEDYWAYGFEDRDLILRLKDTGAKIGFVSESVVFHEEVTNLLAVTNKLNEAGQFSSIIFEKSYPYIYRKMKYGRIDARLHPILVKPIVMLLAPFHAIIFNLSDWVIQNKYAPMNVKKISVKLSSALAYSIGTLKSQTKPRE